MIGGVTMRNANDGPRGRQYEHLELGLLGVEQPADLVAVYSGQVAVQHHDVVPGERQMVERVVAVEDHVDRHALPAEPGPDGAGQDLEVFNDQHSHEPTMPGRRWRHGVSAVSLAGTVLTPARAYNFDA